MVQMSSVDMSPLRNQPIKSRIAVAKMTDCPYEIKLLRQVCPIRLLLILGCVGAFAALVPTERPSVGLMTPVYRTAPGLFGY